MIDRFSNGFTKQAVDRTIAILRAREAGTLIFAEHLQMLPPGCTEITAKVSNGKTVLFTNKGQFMVWHDRLIDMDVLGQLYDKEI